jgi:hypothetical protein
LFLLKYRICDEDLVDRSLENFDDDGIIEGQLELIFNNKNFGFCDKDIPFGHDLLVLWFKMLNHAKNKIKSGKKYVAVPDIESSVWIEFISDRRHITVNLITLKLESFTGYVLTDPIEPEYYHWRGAVIGKDELISEIESKTIQFVNDVVSLNPSLKDSKVLRELKRLSTCEDATFFT